MHKIYSIIPDCADWVAIDGGQLWTGDDSTSQGVRLTSQQWEILSVIAKSQSEICKHKEAIAILKEQIDGTRETLAKYSENYHRLEQLKKHPDFWRIKSWVPPEEA